MIDDHVGQRTISVFAFKIFENQRSNLQCGVGLLTSTVFGVTSFGRNQMDESIRSSFKLEASSPLNSKPSNFNVVA